jgi:hypothetical protein
MLSIFGWSMISGFILGVIDAINTSRAWRWLRGWQ